MKKLLLALVVPLIFIIPSISYAALTDVQMQSVLSLLSSFGVEGQVIQNVQHTLSGTVLGTTVACPSLTVGLGRGSRDTTTNGQVSELQKFLSGYFDVSPSDIVTGYYGVVTAKYVTMFQAAQGLAQVGSVGPQTRAKIASICGGGGTTTALTVPTIKPGLICPALAFVPIECASGALTPRYDANGCQNGWTCTQVASTTLGTLVLTYKGKTLPSVYNVSKEVAQSMCGMLMDWQANAFVAGSSCIWKGQSIAYAGGFKEGDSRVMTFLKPKVNTNETIPITGTYTFSLTDQTANSVTSPVNKYLVYLAKYNPAVSGSIPEMLYQATIFGFSADGTTIGLQWDFGYDGSKSVIPKGSYTISAFNTETGGWGNVSAYTFLVDSPTNGALAVTSPNGGERWELGTMNTITWSPYSYNPDVNPSRDVKAYLEMKDDAGNFVNVGTILPNGKASIHWDGDINTYGKYPTPTDGYYIRVVNTLTGQSDRSDASFTILPKTVDLKVNGVDSGAVVADNQLITLSWTTANYVFSNGCTLSGVRTAPGGPLASVQVPASGSVMYYAYAPVAGSYTSAQLACVDGAKGLTHYDYASYTASASAPAYIKILTPNGGESYSPDAMLNTYYTFAGLKSLSIALYKNDQWLAWLAKDLPVTGSTNGVNGFIPSAAVSGLLTGQQIYKIYITGSKADGTGYVDDKSDSPFSFVSPTPPQNQPPLAPTILGPTTGVVGQSYSFAVGAIDPNGDTVRFGHSNWSASQVVALWAPASGYVGSNSSTLLGNFSWTTIGTKTIWVRAQDSLGALSPWTAHSVTISSSPQGGGGTLEF